MTVGFKIVGEAAHENCVHCAASSAAGCQNEQVESAGASVLSMVGYKTSRVAEYKNCVHGASSSAAGCQTSMGTALEPVPC